jgi:hypothetical protein
LHRMRVENIHSTPDGYELLGIGLDDPRARKVRVTNLKNCIVLVK